MKTSTQAISDLSNVSTVQELRSLAAQVDKSTNGNTLPLNSGNNGT